MIASCYRSEVPNLSLTMY